jgi:hypothetical protein
MQRRMFESMGWKQGVMPLLLLYLLWAQMAVFSPKLHDWLHGNPGAQDHGACGVCAQDAHHEGTPLSSGNRSSSDAPVDGSHRCVVTLFSLGFCWIAVVLLRLAPPVFVERLARVMLSVPTGVSWSIPLSRAPPLFF